MMRKLLYSFLFFIFLHSAVFGQTASTYCFSSSNATYNSLTSFTIPTGMPTIAADDAISSSVPMTFNFVFGGVEYSQLKISNNGWITFGNTTDAMYENNSTQNINNARPVIAPFWDDLRHGNNLAPRYSIEGSAGSRIFKVEWLQQFFYNGSTGDVISFQVWLYEGSNKIDFRYKQGSVSPGVTISATIGIFDASSTHQTLNNAGASQVNTINTNINSRPTTGQVYTYTPFFIGTQAGSDVMFCIDNSNTQTRTVGNGQYALVNVIKGYNYTFQVPNVFTGSNAPENLILTDTSNNTLSPYVANSSNSGATITWPATFSGQVKVFLSSTCGLTGSGTMTLTLNSIGDTAEGQDEYGTNQWIGHIYNFTGNAPPGGFPSPATVPTTTPFATTQYAGYYPVNSETINEGFGGDYTCFPVYSQGAQRASIYTETYAVRYKMKTTKDGCYLITIWGDDGVRLYLNGQNVLDRWVEQGSTTYSNILVRFDGDDDLIFDYYENGGNNTVGFSMVRLDAANPNSITAPSVVNLCPNGDPDLIEGSLQYNSNDPNMQNPQLNFQWQISTDGSTFANILGATGRTYDPPAIANATSVNIVRRFKRLVTLNTANIPDINGVRTNCSYPESNIVTITTSPAAPSQPGTITSPTNICAGSTGNAFSIGAVSGAASYTWSVTGTGWSVTAGANTTTATITVGTGTGSVSVTATNACGTSVAQSTGSLTPTTNTITLTSATGTDSQIVCANTAITDITYSISGATGVDFGTLPAGISGIWSGNVVTISGTPTVNSASSYNYTVTLTGGCGNISATGTITVKPTPTAPTITKNNNVACGGFGSITLTDLPGDWTINQTGLTTGSRSFPGTDSSVAIQNLTVDAYSFTVTNNATGCTSSAALVDITDVSSITKWTDSGWSNGEPDGSKSVVISSVAVDQPFKSNKPNVVACSLTIEVPDNGPNVEIPSNVTLTITNAVKSNGKLVFKSGSSLLQTTNVQNEGDIVYIRETKVRRMDLTYWSMPVTSTKSEGFTMNDFSPTTLYDKYLYWSSDFKWATNLFGTDPMVVGRGYSIRAPQEFDTQIAETFEGKFVGIPNNGDIDVTGPAVDRYFFFGNPYPSAIDVQKLWDANPNVLGPLYFWMHSALPQKAPGDNTYRYSSNDYVIYSATGSVDVSGGADPRTFEGFIAAGQGFFAKPKTTVIHFNNQMREGATSNGDFFKVAKSSSIERNRVWLNIKNAQGAFKQLLVGYIQGATNGFDFNYDAATIGANTSVDFYSINEEKKLTIQGRGLPFENTDIVPLGYKSTIESDFTISIDHADGFFDQQEVYLEDKTTGKTINLRNENYTFSTLAGTFADRFVLRYTNKTLGTGDFENIEDSVLISAKNKVVSITSSKETIKDVNIFNVGAQLMYSKNKVNSSELQINNLHSSDQVLLVKVTLENGSTVSKKVIFSNLQ